MEKPSKPRIPRNERASLRVQLTPLLKAAIATVKENLAKDFPGLVLTDAQCVDHLIAEGLKRYQRGGE